MLKVESVRAAVQDWLTVKIPGISTREVGFVGVNYSYPCLRYSLECVANECDGYDVALTVYAYTEGESSLVATQYIDSVIGVVHKKHHTYGGVKLQVCCQRGAPRIARVDRLWRAEASFDLQAD
jgi:hypothetical protein